MQQPCETELDPANLRDMSNEHLVAFAVSTPVGTLTALEVELLLRLETAIAHFDELATLTA